MILQSLKTLLIFLLLVAVVFYFAHTIARTPGEDVVVTASQTGEVLEIFDALQGVFFDLPYIETITREGRSFTPEQVVRPPLSDEIGRKHPFSGRIVSLTNTAPPLLTPPPSEVLPAPSAPPVQEETPIEAVEQDAEGGPLEVQTQVQTLEL